ncbi:maltose ABC transporter permease MalF, partial [Aeromonas hydrophila]
YISQPVTLMNNKARELAVSEGRAQATPQVIELTPVTGEIASKPAPIRAIVDHRTHLSALDLVLPDGSTHLTLSSL